MVHRRLESERLDALQPSLWEKAMGGEITAADQVIQIISARCRLLGLDLRAKPSTGLAGSPRTAEVTVEEPGGPPDNCKDVWQR